MEKKLIVCALLTFFCQMAFADTCPTVKDIKTHLPKGWKILDSEDEVPLSPAREAQFKKEISEFVLAEWVNESKAGTIHCYYRDKEGSNMEAFVTKDHFKPTMQQSWYQVSGAMQCAAGMAKCAFQPATEQFANR